MEVKNKVIIAEYVAQKNVGAIESGEGEIFAHDWMKKREK